MTWRAVPFAVLLLALFGYAGFPSQPANGLYIAAALSGEVKADPAPPHKFSSPQQEQEYRERDVDLLAGDLAMDDDDAVAPAVAHVQPFALRSSEATFVPAAPVRSAAYRADARAPPSKPMD